MFYCTLLGLRFSCGAPVLSINNCTANLVSSLVSLDRTLVVTLQSAPSWFCRVDNDVMWIITAGVDVLSSSCHAWRRLPASTSGSV